MAKTKYNFFENSYFTEYENVPEVKLQFPLFDEPLDISNQAYKFSNNGQVPIVKNNISENSEEKSESKFIVNNTEENNPMTVQDEQNNSTTIKQTKDLSGNRKKALNYFMGKGLQYHQAAGLVGNLIRESNLDPTAKNKHSGAIGLAQWLGSRKKKLINKYGNNPTFDQQLDFVWEELNSDYKKGLSYLLSSKNVEEAAANAFGWYEFSVGPQRAIREMNKYGQNGQDAYNKGIKFAKSLM